MYMYVKKDKTKDIKCMYPVDDYSWSLVPVTKKEVVIKIIVINDNTEGEA